MHINRVCASCLQPMAQEDVLCPECRLRAGLPARKGTTNGHRADFSPPKLAELTTQFPQLEILELVGQGGMGAVYMARQKDLDRIVALKILPPDCGQGAEFAERFTREAKALAKLNHPGIVTIHDFGQTGGLYFFVMEFVDGINLRQLLEHSQVSPDEAMAIVAQICDALQYAHDHGIVHRDIKPENVLLDRLGRVKVADFGFAQIIGEAGQTPSSGILEASTTSPPDGPSQPTIAKPCRSTEQLQTAGEIDHRADIYALGQVFYELLTGELPGEQLYPPSRKAPIEVRLDAVVLRALELKPDRRYQQVSVMRTHLTMPAATHATDEQGQSSAESLPPLPSSSRGRVLRFGRWLFKGISAFAFWVGLPIALLLLLWLPIDIVLFREPPIWLAIAQVIASIIFFWLASRSLWQFKFKLKRLCHWLLLAVCLFLFLFLLALARESNIWRVAGYTLASVIFFWLAGRSRWQPMFELERLGYWLLLMASFTSFAYVVNRSVDGLWSMSGQVLSSRLAGGPNYLTVKGWLSKEDLTKLQVLNGACSWVGREAMTTLLQFNDPSQARNFLSSLTVLTNFSFAVVLDAQTNLFASYFCPDQITQQNEFIAKIRQVCPGGQHSRIVVYPNLAIAIDPINPGKFPTGYLALGMKLADPGPR